MPFGLFLVRYVYGLPGQLGQSEYQPAQLDQHIFGPGCQIWPSWLIQNAPTHPSSRMSLAMTFSYLFPTVPAKG